MGRPYKFGVLNSSWDECNAFDLSRKYPRKEGPFEGVFQSRTGASQGAGEIFDLNFIRGTPSL